MSRSWFFASLLLGLLLPFSPQAYVHPIYLSLTEITYNPNTSSLEIAIKVFADDFSQVLSPDPKKPLDLGGPQELPQAQALLENYLNQHFKIWDSQGQLLPWHFVGREMERSDFFAMWIYLEVEGLPYSFRAFKVENSLLMDKFASQDNILNFNAPKQNVQRFSLHQGKKRAEIKW